RLTFEKESLKRILNLELGDIDAHRVTWQPGDLRSRLLDECAVPKLIHIVEILPVASCSPDAVQSAPRPCPVFEEVRSCIVKQKQADDRLQRDRMELSDSQSRYRRGENEEGQKHAGLKWLPLQISAEQNKPEGRPDRVGQPFFLPPGNRDCG